MRNLLIWSCLSLMFSLPVIAEETSNGMNSNGVNDCWCPVCPNHVKPGCNMVKKPIFNVSGGDGAVVPKSTPTDLAL